MKAIAAKLVAMAERDRRMRDESWGGKVEWDDSFDAKNAASLQEILNTIGSWPTISKVAKKPPRQLG